MQKSTIPGRRQQLKRPVRRSPALKLALITGTEIDRPAHLATAFFAAQASEEFRKGGKRLFDALLDRAVEPFETVYAEVDPNNTSGMAGRLLLRGFTEETRLFKLTRRAAGECDHSA